jgi:hypothetical protein
MARVLGIKVIGGRLLLSPPSPFLLLLVLSATAQKLDSSPKSSHFHLQIDELPLFRFIRLRSSF